MNTPQSVPQGSSDAHPTAGPDLAQPSAQSKTSLLPVLLAVLSMSVLMFFFQLLKHFLFPQIGLWQSHSLTIVFSTALTAVITWFVLRTGEQTKKALLKSEAHYRGLFEHLNEGAAYCEMIVENGRPNDFIYLAVNPQFVSLRGLNDVIGKRASEVIPGIRENDPELFEIYGRVAATGKPEKFEWYVRSLQTWFEISVYSTKRGFFMTLFDVITERKKKEEELANERLLLRNLVDNLPMAIYLKDNAGRKTLANPSDLRNLGVAAEAETLGKTDFDFFAPEQAAGFQADDQQVFNGRSVLNREEKLTRPDGTSLWLLTSKIPLFNVAGSVTGLVGFGLDITERKQAEEALRASQHIIEGIINTIPVRVFWKDTNLVYLGCNAAFARDAGFANPKDIIGKDDYQMGWRAQADLYRAVDREVIESGRPKLLIEEPQTTPEGNTLTLLTSKMPLRNARGEITGVLGTYLDITERKQANAYQARLAMAVEQSTETIVITDLNGTIQYANPAFEKTSGYTRAEALGRNPRIFKSGRQDAEFYRRMWETLKNGEVWSGHFTNRRKDGTLYEEDATISPVRDAAGTVINYVAVKRDVTREAQLEAQFRQAQKMEAIGHLATGVAHDFNNILAVIQLQAGLLKADPNTSVQQGNIAGDIEQAAERAANLTRQLLLFSRKQKLQLRDLDLNEVVTGIAKMVQRILGEDIHMQLKPSPQVLSIHADAGMVDQILMNLTVNARDAMPGGGHLVIETSAVTFDEAVAAKTVQARPGSFACLSVTDTGCGMPPEILSQIFEPFFTTKEVGRGTGLGLATVFGIVQQHQGWINVYSEVGTGTTFKIYLPRLTTALDAKVIGSPKPAIRGGNEIILVVEDDPPLRFMVKTVLSHHGYQILAAANAREALEIWKQHGTEIGLLLTDLVMPGGMNGRELARQILEQSPKLPVIYASGYSADIGNKDFPLEEGVNFLTKPFEAHKLAQTVRNCLDKI